MLIKTTGLVLRQQNLGDYDSIVTILTRELGLIEATANGVKRIKSRLTGGTQVLSYGEFCLYKGKKYYSINSVSSLKSFYDLRLDVERLSLASYFCDLTRYLLPEGTQNAWPFLRLLLNTLTYLEQGKRELLQLKSLYELRLLSLSGFMPDLVACQGCGCFEDDEMLFFPLSGRLSCSRCKRQEDLYDPVPPAVLRAMRHILYADDTKLFSFKVSGTSLLQLCYVIEHYLLVQTEREFKSLSMFWQFHNMTAE